MHKACPRWSSVASTIDTANYHDSEPHWTDTHCDGKHMYFFFINKSLRKLQASPSGSSKRPFSSHAFKRRKPNTPAYYDFNRTWRSVQSSPVKSNSNTPVMQMTRRVRKQRGWYAHKKKCSQPFPRTARRLRSAPVQLVCTQRGPKRGLVLVCSGRRRIPPHSTVALQVQRAPR
jgi:hypothetical protein